MGMVACFATASADALASFKAEPGLIEGYLYPDSGDEPPFFVDIDKAWHGIHFLLTGVAFGGDGPMALAVLGGTETGPDLGQGPARLLGPEQVRAVALALGNFNERQFCERFDPQAMETARIYPTGIWVRDGQEGLDYLLGGYEALVDFYRDAARRGDGAILWIS